LRIPAVSTYAAAIPDRRVNWKSAVIRMAEESHPMQEARMTNGSRKVQ
jgi:hypothetical protein